MEAQEFAYGIVVFIREDVDRFLILQHNNKIGSWSYPKGHMDEGESPIQTAVREVFEESGIKDIKILDYPMIKEEYYPFNRPQTLKNVFYFIGEVYNKDVTVQKSEIQNYKWATFEEAMETFQYKSRKEVLQEAKKYLESIK